MSLHAELSPEAQENLRRMKRNSTISSVVIAALTLVLIGLTLGLILTRIIVKETPTIVTYRPDAVEDDNLETAKVQTNTTRKPSSPSSNIAKVIVANTISDTSVPTPDVDVSVPAMEFGDAEDLGSWGNESGDDGATFASIPATMKKRCSKADRLARLQETGGTAACEDAVVKALTWMKSRQSSDGSWGTKNASAMTALSLLAYLGHCETPLSKDFGDSSLRAITYLVNLGTRTGGKLSTNPADKTWCYEHAIATYALAEAYTFCEQGRIDIPNLKEVVQQAGQWIIDNQDKSGAWDYSYNNTNDRDGDLSIAAWHIQAIKACNHTGIEFKGLHRCMNNAIGYVEKVHNKDSGGFGYDSPNSGEKAGYQTLTGAGMLSMQMAGKGEQSIVRDAAKYIVKNSKFDFNGIHSDLYGHYYEAQAMMNRGGEDWKFYNNLFRDQLLNNQNADGSWKTPNGGTENNIRAMAPAFINNVHYRTALCTLMLEVYYRFLPGTNSGVR